MRTSTVDANKKADLRAILLYITLAKYPFFTRFINMDHTDAND